MSNLYRQDGAEFKSLSDPEIIKAGEHAIRRKLKAAQGRQFKSRQAFQEYLPVLLGGRDYETFCVAFLDCQARLIAFEEMFRGGHDGVQAPTREICKRAIELGAHGIICVHNHPGGVAEPSNGDVQATFSLQAACKLFDIEIIDSLIVAGTTVGSMREQGAFDMERQLKALVSRLKGESLHNAA